jgi:hypothetical protein
MNEYDSIIDEALAEKEQSGLAVVNESMKLSPDDAALAVKWAQDENADFGFAMRNIEDVRRHDYIKQRATILRNDKNLGEWFQEPTQAAEAWDDIDSLTKVTDGLSKFGYEGVRQFGRAVEGMGEKARSTRRFMGRLPSLYPESIRNSAAMASEQVATGFEFLGQSIQKGAEVTLELQLTEGRVKIGLPGMYEVAPDALGSIRSLPALEAVAA